MRHIIETAEQRDNRLANAQPRSVRGDAGIRRAALVRIRTEVADIRAGRVRIETPSPRSHARYGRHYPTPVAIAFAASYAKLDTYQALYRPADRGALMEIKQERARRRDRRRRVTVTR